MSSVFTGFLLSHEAAANKKQTVATSVERLLHSLVVLQGNISNFFKGADWKNHMVQELVHKQSLWHTHLLVLGQTIGILVNKLKSLAKIIWQYFKWYKMSEILIYRLICMQTVLKRESAVDKAWCGTISSTKANWVNCVMLLPCCTTSTTACFICNFMLKTEALLPPEGFLRFL